MQLQHIRMQKLYLQPTGLHYSSIHESNYLLLVQLLNTNAQLPVLCHSYRQSLLLEIKPRRDYTMMQMLKLTT